MKIKLLLFMFLAMNLAFGQATTNQSAGAGVAPSITNPIIGFPGEAFRFRSGLVTQLDNGNNFDLTSNSPLNSRWFSIGSLNTGSQTVYGLRFQERNKSITFGYNNINSINPRIQWIGTGQDLGNLEFRVANNFTSTNSTLVASMSPEGTTTFGDLSVANGLPRVVINSSANDAIFESTGLLVNAVNSQNVTAIRATAFNGSFSNIGVFGEATPFFTSAPAFAAGIYGRALNFNTLQQWAGFFDGRIFATQTPLLPSDIRLKEIILPNDPFVLPRLLQLKPVTYNFKDIKELNLPKTLQHGFIAQDVEKIFPELVSDVTKPTFDDKGQVTGNFSFKAMEYTGFISMLVSGIQELHQEIKILKQELAVLRSDKAATQINTTETANTGVFMKQNIPNPFTESTTISYQLPEGTTTADIMVFDFNGKPIKTFPINKNESEITISAAELGKGLFIYSLVQNGQELVTKKMIIN